VGQDHRAQSKPHLPQPRKSVSGRRFGEVQEQVEYSETHLSEEKLKNNTAAGKPGDGVFDFVFFIELFGS
jgi:hypothetical protein